MPKNYFLSSESVQRRRRITRSMSRLNNIKHIKSRFQPKTARKLKVDLDTKRYGFINIKSILI